jgi:hypothetical protein
MPESVAELDDGEGEVESLLSDLRGFLLYGA